MNGAMLKNTDNQVNQLNQVNSEGNLWANQSFLFLWFGKVISNFGYQIYIIALPLLIYELSKSALAMSMMRAVDFLPNIFIGMLAGVLVDRFNRKRIMVYTTALQMLSLTGVIFLLYVEQLAVWHLYILGFILSASGYTFGNSQHSALPQIVSKQQLTAANAKLTFIDTLITMIGPGLAGFIIAFYSYQISFSIYLLCLLVMFIFLLFVQIPQVERVVVQDTSIWKDMKEGIDELLANKILLTPTLITVFTNLAASLVVGVLVFYAADSLQASEKEIGLMFSMGAIGGLIGSLIVTKLRQRFGRGEIYAWTIFVNVVSMLVLLFSFTWWAIGLSLLIRTMGVTVSNIVYFTIRQEFTPNHLLGRVAGTSSMLMKLALPLGLFIAGLWAEYLPIQWLFLFATLILIALFIVALKSKFRAVQ